MSDLSTCTCGTNELEGLAKLMACSNGADRAFALDSYAQALARTGYLEEALRISEQRCVEHPESAEAQWRMADRLVNLGRYREAAQAYSQSQRLCPGSEDALMGMRYVEHLLRTQCPGDACRPARPDDMSELQKANLARSEQDCLDRKSRAYSMPTLVFLECTSRCNFHCEICSRGYVPYYAGDIHDETLQRLDKEVIPYSTQVCISSVGEPMMGRRYKDIRAMCAKHGPRLEVITNASLLTIEQMEFMVRHSTYIILSIDGATAGTFEEIRKGSSFPVFLENVAMLKKLRDIYLSHSFSFMMFNVCGMRKNAHELPDIVRLAKHYEVDRVRIGDLNLVGQDIDMQSLKRTPELGNHWIGETTRVAAELGVELLVPSPYDPLPESGTGILQRVRSAGGLLPARRRFVQRCKSPWTMTYVHMDGTVSPCCAAAHISVGNLRVQPFRKIWNNMRYRMLRLRIHSPLPPVYCRNCFVPWGINGDRPERVHAKEGLIIRGIYHAEVQLRHLATRIRRRFSRRVLGKTPAPPPAPNYFKGRPSPSATGSTDAETKR